MANHYVTCVYCHQKFDREKEPTAQVASRRYAHASCLEAHKNDLPKEEQDFADLEEYIKKIFKVEQLSQKIRNQISKFIQEEDYTYYGILMSLTYFFSVKNNSTEKANGGIGIVPYIYKEAEEFYSRIYAANKENEEREIIQSQQVKIKIKDPQREIRKKNTFSFLDLDNNEEGNFGK